MDPGENEPSREELASRVAELEQTVSKMLPDRRGVLKGLGAAAVGGAAVGGATGGASGQSASGQVGTASNPVDVEGAQGKFDSVNTGQASITDPVTMYVRSDGDDANTGLSADDAKATIQSAVEDAAISNYQRPVTVDLDDGSYGAVDLRRIPTPDLRIEGVTDGSGNPATTLTATGVAHVIEVNQIYLELANLIIDGGDQGPLRAEYNAAVRPENCTFQNGPEHALQLNFCATYQDDADTICDQTAVNGSGASINVLMRSSARFNGLYKGDGGGRTVIRIKEGGQALVSGTLEGEGTNASGTSQLIELAQHGSAKIFDVTGRDATFLVDAQDDSQYRVKDRTLDNVPGLGRIRQGAYGRDVNNNLNRYAIPKNSSTPSWGLDVDDGQLHHNDSLGAPEVFSKTLNGTLQVFGGVLQDSADRTVSAGGTDNWAFSGENSIGTPLHAMVYPDSTQTDPGVIQWRWRVNASQSRVELNVQEVTGNNNIDYHAIVYKIPTQ